MNTLISAAAGGIAGFIKFAYSSHMENKRLDLERQVILAGGNLKDLERAGNIKDRGVSLTRRTMALSFTFTLCAIALSPLFLGSEATLTLPQDVVDRSFWDYVLPWREGKVVTQYITAKAPVLAAPIVDLAAACVAFYFGSGGSRSR